MKENGNIWTSSGFLDEFLRIEKTMRDRSFAFLLGAGTSVTSGIPSARTMAGKWLKELYELENESRNAEKLENWARERLRAADLSLEKVEEYYPRIFEQRFADDPDSGFAYLEDAMRSAEPGVGYSILAQILADTRHNTVITTNFDNLVAGALSIYTRVQPLVCGHESLTGFIRPKLRRPLVAKVHRDLFLAPKNDQDGVGKLEGAWTVALSKILSENALIVIGYGGNDGSLMGFLNGIDAGKINNGRNSLFWCYRKEDGLPKQAVQDLVSKHKGKFVPILGFDELMVELGGKLEYGLLNTKIVVQASERAEKYRKNFEDFKKKITEYEANRSGQGFEEVGQALKGIVQSSHEADDDWWVWELKAGGEEDPVKKEEIYRQGIEKHGKSAELTGNFAVFMHNIRKDYAEAERLYRRALELDPKNALHTGNFAIFMHNIRKDYAEAERLYRRALELDPKNALHTGNFANFMENIRTDYAEAERLYRRALELDPKSALYTGNFAVFMHNIRKDNVETEQLYRRALELDPKSALYTGNFAVFMHNIRKDYAEAERLYRKVLELDPKNALHTGNFANFMENIRKDYAEAERLYRRALELDPKSAIHTGNFANFMHNIRNDYAEAERLYRRALELDPKSALYTGNFAVFMHNIRKDNVETEQLYRRALELDPKSALYTGNFAVFMENIRKDYAEAERLYRRALELDPKNATITARFAYFVDHILKNHVEAERLHRLALELNPEDFNFLANYVASLISCKNFDRAYDQTVSAWKHNGGIPHQSVSEFLLYASLLKHWRKEEEVDCLVRMKALFKEGFLRISWNFDNVLAAAEAFLDAENRKFYRALADAVLDEQKVQSLEKFQKWRDLETVPPDRIWAPL